MATPTNVNMATATPGGGFPLFGDNAAATINETDPSLAVQTHNTKGSAENITLLEQGKMDIALVAGEPAYEAFAGIGRAPTNLKIISAIYSNPGMFAVKGDSAAKQLRDLVGKPVAWGTRASGLTLLGRYVTDGLGLDREKDFQAHYLDKAGDGPVMVADGRVAALWGGGIGWPGFTAIMKAGGRFIGLTPDEVAKVSAKHNFLKPIRVPAGSYEGQKDAVDSVGSWSFILARTDLPDDIAYRLAKALHQGHAALIKRLAQ
jgi:TRAP transporter TAXI family solute receptor